MNLKKTLVLGVLLLAAYLYVIYVELPKQEAQGVENRIFNGVEKDELASLEVSSLDSSYKLVNSDPQKQKAKDDKNPERQISGAAGTKWQLDGLPEATLDQGALNTLLAALLSLDTGKAIPEAEIDKDLSVYELDKPRLKLTAQYHGQSKTINFGKTNEYVGKRYLSINGKPQIYLVDDQLFSQASRARDDLRDHTPLDFVDGDLASIKLSAGPASEALQINSAEHSKWRISAPIKASASYSAVSNYTNTLRNLRVDQFIDAAGDKLSTYGLTQPALTLAINFKEDLKRAPIELLVSSLKEKDSSGTEQQVSYLMLKGQSTVFKSSGELVATLKKSVEELREKRFFEFVTDQVKQADFQLEAGAALSLIRSGEKWSVNGGEADSVFVRQLLSNLSALEAIAFPLENRDFGFNKPFMKVVLRLSESGPEKKSIERVLTIGAKEVDAKDDRRYAAVDEISEPFVISAEALKGITPKLESLQKNAATPAPLLTRAPSGK